MSIFFAVSAQAESDKEVIVNDEGQVIQEISYGEGVYAESILETAFYTYSATGKLVEKRTVNNEGKVINIEKF